MLDINDKKFIKEEFDKLEERLEERLEEKLEEKLNEKVKDLATKKDLTREIESLALITQQGFDEIEYRLGNTDNKIDGLVLAIEQQGLEVTKLKHSIGLS